MSFDPKQHLMNIKGKDYLPVAGRLLWLSHDAPRYSIQPKVLKLEDTYAIVCSTVIIFDDAGTAIRSATATKREDKTHFPDFLEKAETGSIGRALGMLGFGTQYAEEFNETNTLPTTPPPKGEPRVVDAPQPKRTEVQALSKNNDQQLHASNNVETDIIKDIEEALGQIKANEPAALKQKSKVYIGATFETIMTAGGGLYKRAAEKPDKLSRLYQELEALLA
jgi:hypothetical protein